jgi:hypothetical protein
MDTSAIEWTTEREAERRHGAPVYVLAQVSDNRLKAVAVFSSPSLAGEALKQLSLKGDAWFTMRAFINRGDDDVCATGRFH